MRALLLESGLSSRYWAQALQHATTLHNWSPKATNPDHASPYVRLYKRPPPLELLHKFGDTAYGHVPTRRLKDKHVTQHSIKGRYLGVALHVNQKAMHLLVNNRIVTTVNVTSVPPSGPCPAGGANEIKPGQNQTRETGGATAKQNQKKAPTHTPEEDDDDMQMAPTFTPSNSPSPEPQPQAGPQAPVQVPEGLGSPLVQPNGSVYFPEEIESPRPSQDESREESPVILETVHTMTTQATSTIKDLLEVYNVASKKRKFKRKT